MRDSDKQALQSAADKDDANLYSRMIPILRDLDGPFLRDGVGASGGSTTTVGFTIVGSDEGHALTVGHCTRPGRDSGEPAGDRSFVCGLCRPGAQGNTERVPPSR
jgi:hypothetical protein